MGLPVVGLMNKYQMKLSVNKGGKWHSCEF